ncbi:magnesium chelatase, partial [alpha proteobacterium AAP81b]
GTVRKAPAGGRGARQRDAATGRPSGARAGAPGRGKKLALLETIRAAAPWQRLRAHDAGRLAIRRDDLHVRRNVARTPASTVFAVDASGSAAFARLAEAKGAVELLLAEAYVKRAEVALVAFRGEGATLALPPTRSLTRARRELAALAGGGGTPIAAGLDMAREVATRERARGRSPVVVVLTDGRANIGPEGTIPQDAALASARALAASGLPTVFIDCGTRPRPEARALADAMAARYAALPRLGAESLAAMIKAAA